MLLAEFMKLAHATTADDREVPVDLNQVTAFEFGEHYLIRMRNGKTLDVRDFEDILDILRGEFTLWKEQWVPEASIRQQTGKGLMAAGRYLSVKPQVKSDFLPAIPPDAAVERIRLAVTMFNLTGTWDQFNTGNL